MHPSQDLNTAEIAKLLPEDYQGGKDVTTRLLKVLNLKEYRSLSDVFDVSWGTISTWHRREQTPFEIAVRVHLATGVSLRWLLLGEGDMLDSNKPSISSDKVELPYFQLDNGELLDKGKMFFDPQFLEGMPDAEHLMLVEHEGKKLFVDTSNTKVISGEYLVQFDGLASVNELHRIPGGKIHMSFNGKDIEVEENKMTILGKVITHEL
ncbi:helix-turn-helix domain-containing protein [Photobacterium sp. DA100]|uniref:helix-turn-helix domain-containing protein n=1 Tax=Photobacterium sp. DA100 TaxID=3027472 RepID=UPI00247A9308|nr:helix-turn-helix domain-containing protein [Photobacterium sp. DA100]WEM43490.1 helix-turn-helix domain-containing protein [Photobacterium sp. DA100]